MNTDLQTKTTETHNGVMVFMAIAFTFIFAAHSFLPVFVLVPDGAKELLASMKDATVNIMMVIIGYVFGSSAGSLVKNFKPTDNRENPS